MFFNILSWIIGIFLIVIFHIMQTDKVQKIITMVVLMLVQNLIIFILVYYCYFDKGFTYTKF